MLFLSWIASLIFSLPGLVKGAAVTWNGGGADNNWGTALNWGGQLPLSGDSLFFGGALRLTAANNLTADTQFAGITFNADAEAFTLSGNRIILGGDVTNNSTFLQTLSLAMLMQATRTFDAAAGSLTLSGILSGDGGLTKIGTQTLTLSGTASNTYTGLTSVEAGILRLDKTSNRNAVAGNLDIRNGGKVTFARSHQLADTTVVTVSGLGSVFNGQGTNSMLTSNLTETIGGLTMTGGSFNAGSGSNWTIDGAGSFTGGSENTIFVGNSSARLTFGSLSLTNMPATAGGTVPTNNSFTLYGNSPTLGIITIKEGGLFLDGSRLNLRGGNSEAAGSKLVLNSDVTVTGTTASAIWEDTAGGRTGMVRVELGGDADPVERVFDVSGGGASLTINVEITNGASLEAGLTKTGAGRLTLSGDRANSYSGLTRVNGGELVLNQSDNVIAVAGDIIVNSGGTLTMAADEQIANTAGITVNTGGTISGWLTTETIAYYTQNGGGLTASDNSGQVTITGALTLSGGNTFTINSLPGSAIAPHFQARSVVLTGANILIGGNNGTGNPRTALTVGSDGLSMAGRTITLYRGNSGVTLNLNGDFSGTGNNFILVSNSGTIEPHIDLGNAVRIFDITSGTTDISVGIVGNGGITKTGNGTLTFTGYLPKTYTGTTTVSGGILDLDQTAGTDAITGPLVIATGGTLLLSQNEQIANTTGITVQGGTISGFTTQETLAYYTQETGGFLASGNRGDLTVLGTVKLLGGRDMTINSGGADAPVWEFYAAELTGAGMLVGGNNGVGNPKTSLTIGEGGLTLGGRTITLNRGNAGVEMHLLGNLTATGTNSITTGSSGAVEAELHLGTGTRTFQITSGTTTIGVKAMGAAAIEKTGNGTLVMNTASTYSGGTTISAGTLRILNTTGSATGSGAFILASPAILTGNGRIASAADMDITVNGTLTIGAPSQTAGNALTLSTSGMGSLEIGGRVNIDLFSGQQSGVLNAATTADMLVLEGADGLTLGAGAILSISTSIAIDAENSAGWVEGTSWQVIDWSGLTGGVTGSFSNLTGSQVANFPQLPDLSPLGFFWDVSNLYTTGVITVVIPEPSRLFLVFVGIGALGMRRRRVV
ncbi:autotransporter-associated beta strand repeat-containing protein [Prosthecobacter fusiformis]|uniref:autotransporter-associated beta strand repeat-containing protein n=1 Tax=Prosthecobacter fusiformis TaxID=48464 RepID=UPI001AAFAED0|nr:autotransporter-associated beta strand repeat-containing protein [Prosthecobacter fusiformis]